MKPMNPVTKPMATIEKIIPAQVNMGTLFTHTAFTLVITAVAKSTLRSINIGCVKAVTKNIPTQKTAPTIEPSTRNGNKLSKLSI